MSAPLTSRRALLTGAAVLSIAPLAASAGAMPFLAVEPQTPIRALFRQWEALIDQASVPGLPDEEAEALDARRYPVEQAIAAEPATDLRDLAIKVLVNTGEGCFGLDDAITLECASLAGRDFGKLPRCLFEEAAERLA